MQMRSLVVLCWGSTVVGRTVVIHICILGALWADHFLPNSAIGIWLQEKLKVIPGVPRAGKKIKRGLFWTRKWLDDCGCRAVSCITRMLSPSFEFCPSLGDVWVPSGLLGRSVHRLFLGYSWASVFKCTWTVQWNCERLIKSDIVPLIASHVTRITGLIPKLIHANERWPFLSLSGELGWGWGWGCWWSFIRPKTHRECLKQG